MAPGYRNQNRRQNRGGYVDHDVFEGLPVRHWRRDFVTVAPPPSQDGTSSQNDIWAVELPHGMPKDYHLLPQHSQDLLRGARSGRIYKRPAPIEEDEVDAEGIIGDKPEKKEDETKDRGFSAKAWKQIPRHLEGPDVEYLAKRRKTVVTIGSKAPKPVPTVTKAKLKRVDAAGNEYIQDVIVPHGQQIEGEVISQTEIPDPNAIPRLAQPTPTKRKPVIRKKTKGPGRGRKKKPMAPTSAPTSQIPGAVEVNPAPAIGPDGVNIEDSGSAPPPSEDTEMRDGSAAASDEESSDEGEEGDEDDGSVDHASPSKRSRRDSGSLPSPAALQDIPDLLPDDPMTGLELETRPILHLENGPKSGSPLKIVAMATSTLTSPLESTLPAAPFSTQVPTEPQPEVQELDEQLQQEATETAPAALPSIPPHPTEDLIPVSMELLAEELEEEKVLLKLDEGNHIDTVESEDQVVETTQELPTPVPDVVREEAKEASPDILPPREFEPKEIEPKEVEPKEVEPTEVESTEVESTEVESKEVESKEVDEAENLVEVPDILGDMDQDEDLYGDLVESLGSTIPAAEAAQEPSSLGQLPSSDSELTVDSVQQEA